MTYLAEKLLQLEFLVKSITQCRLAEDDNCGTAISIQFLDHPEQRVCNLPKAVSKQNGVASVTAVNVGKTYTFAVPDSGGSCSPKPVCLKIKLYNLQGESCSSGDLELASGESVVRPTTLADVGCRPDTAEKDDATVPLTDCHGRTVAVLSVRVRAWVAGTVTTTPIDSPPVCPPLRLPSCPALCPPTLPSCLAPSCPPPCPAPSCPPPPCPTPISRPASVDSYRKKPAECCSSQAIREPTSSCGCKPAREPVTCCKKPTAREPCCNRPPPKSCCNKPPARDPPNCCNRPLPREPRTSCCNKTVRKKPSPCGCQCANVCSASDRNERSAIDQPHRQYTDIGCEIDGRKIDFRVRKKHCDPCVAQRRLTMEAEKFISKVVNVVKDMHGLVKDTVNMVD